MSEKRTYPRFVAQVEVEVKTDAGVVATGKTANLSMGGLCAHVDGAVTKGATVEVSLRLVFSADSSSEALELPARVAWSTQMGEVVQVGCSFIRLDGEQRRYLEMFLRYLEQSS